MTYCKVFLLLMIFSTIFIINLYAGPCPDLKVKIKIEIHENAMEKMQHDYGTTGKSLENQIIAEVERLFQGNSEGFEFYSGADADYQLRVQINTIGDNYWLNTYLQSMSTAKYAEQVYLPEVSDIHSGLTRISAEHGNIEALLKAYEMKHTTPVRDPTITVAVDPDEISAEEGNDQCKITVKVLHCNGEPAYYVNTRYSQKVFFKKETQRGKVKSTFWKSDFVFTQTLKNGVAEANYQLDHSKGTHPGIDKVEIWTYGPRLKIYKTFAIIKIKPSDGILEIEKLSGELPACNFENRCVVQLPFEMIKSKDSENYEIKGGASNRTAYTLKCRGCNVITGTFWAKITGGVLDIKRKPKKPLSLSFEIFRDNEVHKITCRQPPLEIPRDKQQQMDMKLHNWPLIDGYSEQIGVFKYTIHLGRASY